MGFSDGLNFAIVSCAKTKAYGRKSLSTGEEALVIARALITTY